MPDKCLWEGDIKASKQSLSGEISADVCVVGLGGSGLSCIKELISSGKSVIGVDAGIIGGSAAGRNGGLLLGGSAGFYHDVVRDFGRDRARALYRQTLWEIERMKRLDPDIIEISGSLRIAADEGEITDCRLQMEAMKQDGLSVEWYKGTQGEGLLFPGDGSMQPWERVRRLALGVEEGGANLFEKTKVVAIESGLVVSDGGMVRCSEVVIAVDGGLELIVPELEDRVMTSRLQMLSTVPIERRIGRPAYYRYGMEYWHQRPDGRVALGGGRDKSEEWGLSRETTRTVQDYLNQVLLDRLGIEADQIENRWASNVGYTKSGYPVVEEVKDGVWALGGYCGTGNLIGAIAGRAVARCISGDSVLMDILLKDGDKMLEI